MSIDVIVACTTRGGLGKDGDLLIKNKVDLQRFRSLSEGNWCVMGSKTFESLPKPFANGRTNVVVTRQEKYQVDPHVLNKYDILIENSLDKIINHYRSGENTRHLCICGGGEIYRQSLVHADRVFLTLFHDDTDDFDVSFPLEYVEQHFDAVYIESFYDDNMMKINFIDYVRKDVSAY